jgi:hypothetical protein
MSFPSKGRSCGKGSPARADSVGNTSSELIISEVRVKGVILPFQ